MKTIPQLICWAVAMTTAVLASLYGPMDRGSAITLMIVLPIVAWSTLTGRGLCLRRRREG
jgi:hypothetical protein